MKSKPSAELPDFDESYWSALDAHWTASAKPTMDTELANIRRRDAQRQGPYVFPVEQRMYQDRGDADAR